MLLLFLLLLLLQWNRTVLGSVLVGVDHLQLHVLRPILVLALAVAVLLFFNHIVVDVLLLLILVWEGVSLLQLWLLDGSDDGLGQNLSFDIVVVVLVDWNPQLQFFVFDFVGYLALAHQQVFFHIF